MKLTAQVKLLPTPDQHKLLVATLEAANRVCNVLSDIAWQTKTFGAFALQRLVYHEIRSTYGLPAQMLIRCLSKVADSYKQDQTTLHTFALWIVWPSMIVTSLGDSMEGMSLLVRLQGG